MGHRKKEHKHHVKESAERDVKPKKKATSRKKALLTRLMPRSRKGLIKVSIAAIVLVAVVGVIPFPHAFAKTVAVDFVTENQQNAGLELGDSKVLQEGRAGSKVVNVDAYQSIWGRLLGLEPIQQKVVSEKIIDKPTSKIVATGSRKYQYMMCSDGSSRYYTDEQFKDPNTGFTSKSVDYCKENGQGKMVKLSDTSTGDVTTNPERLSTVTVRDGCTYTPIPYKTVYQDVAWLNKGETKVYEGRDGTKSSCGWSTEPSDKQILRGTSEPSPGFNPGSSNTTDSAAYARCQSAYNSAMSQIQASISQGMSGQDALKRQVESEFARCKRAAGY